MLQLSMDLPESDKNLRSLSKVDTATNTCRFLEGVLVTKLREYLSYYQPNSHYYHCEPSILNKDQTSTGYNMVRATDEDTAKIKGTRRGSTTATESRA